ncbi:MAG: sigma-70 family RNA polymerase sigma factor [Dictyoglomus sp.]|nr:sigma-70 family RNA polymerase sigma factor [Dictyoglomus sp.]MCX7942029.1 sigma-70 family RNA polymerase sigma factor [Dictyoglomaceae bacterium]MDW8188709.1 sigma-70 family RNA polymerase sigma factor [Dictyoglomus sp.]
MSREIEKSLELNNVSSQLDSPLGWEEKTNLSDKALISLIKSGDREAFNILVKRYEKKVFNILYLQLGPISDLEDLAQEVFIKIFKNINKFRGEAQFSTWLYRIVLNLSYDYKRKNKNIFSLDENIDYESEETFENILPTSEEDPEKVLERLEVQRKIRDAIKGLSKEYQEVIILREFEGLSYEEIAKVLNCPVGTVESRLFRAREELRKKLIKEWKES